MNRTHLIKAFDETSGFTSLNLTTDRFGLLNLKSRRVLCLSGIHMSWTLGAWMSTFTLSVHRHAAAAMKKLLKFFKWSFKESCTEW